MYDAQPPNIPPRRRRRQAQGQALVEFALIIPVFLLIFFGTIEFALILASIGGFNFAARDAARIGSFIGRSDPTADAQIVADANAHVRALVMARGVELDIFRSTADGQCYTTASGSGSTVPVDDPTCVADRYNMDGTAYGGASPLWPVGDRDDTLANADYLGVRIVFQYNWLTAFISNTGVALRLSAISVQRIEPLQFTHRHQAPPGATAWTWLSLAHTPLMAVPALAGALHLSSTASTDSTTLWRRPDTRGGHG